MPWDSSVEPPPTHDSQMSHLLNSVSETTTTAIGCIYEAVKQHEICILPSRVLINNNQGDRMKNKRLVLLLHQRSIMLYPTRKHFQTKERTVPPESRISFGREKYSHLLLLMSSCLVFEWGHQRRMNKPSCASVLIAFYPSEGINDQTHSLHPLVSKSWGIDSSFSLSHTQLAHSLQTCRSRRVLSCESIQHSVHSFSSSFSC